jgi:3-dehydroquinate synthase
MKERIEDQMLEAGIGRDGGIVAFGGGVVGDLAGFVAATYLRGIPFIQVPTTLLAQVDSSIGGKVGVNTRQGKNLIGAFHQPVAVLADTRLLSTLPKRQFRSGMAELIKHAIIGDSRLFDDLENDMEDLLRTPQDVLPSALLRSIRVKADVVAKDEKEGGLRKILNWGHTVGHAVEAMSRYRLFHGEALSIGMAVEATLCCRSGWLPQEDAQREIRLLEKAGLPTGIPKGMDPLALLRWTRSDKKARAGRVEYPVHDRIGSMAPLHGRYSIPVADKDVLEAIKARDSRSSGL